MCTFIMAIILVPSWITMYIAWDEATMREVYGYRGALTLTAFLGVLSTVAASNAFITTVIDPGFVGTPSSEAVDELLLEKLVCANLSPPPLANTTGGDCFEWSADVHAKAREQVPLVHPCPVCRVGVMEYDHHCNIVGACIGKRNYFSFVTFLTAVALLLPFGVTVNASYLFANVRRPAEMPLTMIELVFAIQFRWLVSLALLAYSLYGPGYCTFLSLFYWIAIQRNMHCCEKRRPSYVPPPGASLQSAWSRIRSVFAEAWHMELSSSALRRQGKLLNEFD